MDTLWQSMQHSKGKPADEKWQSVTTGTQGMRQGAQGIVYSRLKTQNGGEKARVFTW